jgi:hypothetical protein
MVSSPGKEGADAKLGTYDGGARVRYLSDAGNIAGSGQNNPGGNSYVSVRTASGWETIPDLNGSSGSMYDAPLEISLAETKFGFPPTAYSSDLLSSLWNVTRKDGSIRKNLYLRGPDGTFTLIGSAKGVATTGGGAISLTPLKYSVDLSHVITYASSTESLPGSLANPSEWGPGVYEFVGTGVTQPRRVDLDNAGSPVSACTGPPGPATSASNATAHSISAEGRVIVFTAFGGCGGANPSADELWARINGTTAVDVSASHCNRLDCNAPSNPTFGAATRDGSRVFFTTTQQLINGDTDQTNDLYACDIPSGNPAPTAEKANHCSAFRHISAAETGAAEVENVLSTSEDGSTVLFTAKGVLAANEDALKEKALTGDNNLYVWRQDSAHPAGQATFVARLELDDLRPAEVLGGGPQATPDGRSVVFTTANQLIESDTDKSRDVYRYDADAGELIRASTNISGVGGNGSFDAAIGGPTEHHPTTTISDDGQKIVFTTVEALSSADGNGEADVYLWSAGRVHLISTGSVGGGAGNPAINGSGQDIYFNTPGALTPADVDDLSDVYDAHIGGGFSFAPAASCSGEACQPPPPASPPTPDSPASRPNGEGNLKPKTCPKGKVVKANKCVKKAHKKHHKKSHGKKASRNRGGHK